MATSRYVPKLTNVNETDSAKSVARQLNSVQSELTKAVAGISSCPFLFGVGPLPVTVPTAGSVTINHGLGHIPQGFIIIDQTTDGTFWASAGDERTITFSNAGGTDVVSKVWVY